MEKNQVELLKKLAVKIKSEKKNRKNITISLQSAKILTKNEKFTGHFKNLEKVFATVE